jgi:LPS export ABC transporter protein LptC
MLNIFNRFSVIVILTLLTLLFVINISPVLGDSDRTAPASVPSASGLGLTDIHITETDSDGLLTWELWAKKALYTIKDEEAILTDFTASFYSMQGDKITLRGDKGEFFHNSRNIKIKGDISVKVQAYDLKTQSIDYDGEKRLAASETPVTITGPEFSLDASSMLIDINRQTIRFSGGVTSQLKGMDPNFHTVLFDIIPFGQ